MGQIPTSFLSHALNKDMVISHLVNYIEKQAEPSHTTEPLMILEI